MDKYKKNIALKSRSGYKIFSYVHLVMLMKSNGLLISNGLLKYER